MSNISSALASFYTTKTASKNTVSDEQVELFTKIAAEQGVDVNALSDEQVSQLWNATFSGEEESLKQAADAEFLEKQAMAQDIAKFDALGRIAAHAFAEEAEKIAGDDLTRRPKASDGRKRSTVLGTLLDRGDKSKMEGIKYDAGRKASFSSDTPSMPGGKFLNGFNRNKAEFSSGNKLSLPAKGMWDKAKELASQHGSTAGKAALVAGALGAAGYGIHRATRDKEASAIDAYAFQAAFDKLAEDGWDTDEAAERLNALATLGVGDSTKIAYAQNTEQAVDLRAFELIEQAGYPVNWGG